MKITAAVLDSMGRPRPYAESEPLAVEELDLDPPAEGEVLVRVRAAGLCHSDLSVISGDRPRPTPMALGHEAAGEVIEVGAGVRDLKPGDHVVMVFVPSCGHCPPCAEGRPALCEPAAASNNAGTLLGGGHRLHRRGQDVNHHLGVSAFSDHAVLSQRSLVKIASGLPFAEAALFGCAVLTGVGAVINTARVPAGSTVAVVGLGGVGLNSLLGAHLAGARQLIAVDVHDEKLRLARQIGATAAVNVREGDAVGQVKDLTGGGVDFAFEMAGSVQALGVAYRMTRRGGTTVTAGLPPPDETWPVPAVNLVAEERTLKGIYVGSSIPLRDVPRYIELYQRGKLPVDKLMGETLELSEINSAFDRLASGLTTRQVVVF